MIHIWVRRRLDWADEEAVVPQLADASTVPLWNATFNISYQRFRHRVAQIAQLNHSRVEGAAVSEWDEIPDGAVVMPVDDDDWFAPAAARTLEAELDPAAIGYVWPSRWIERPFNFGHRMYLLRHRVFPKTPPRWICSTNSYAMVKRAGVQEALADHIAASRLFEGPVARGEPTIRRIDDNLNLVNRTLASQTALGLRKDIGRSELLRRYRRHRKLYERRLAPDLEWARPYVEMMSELMGELEVRR